MTFFLQKWKEKKILSIPQFLNMSLPYIYIYNYLVFQLFSTKPLTCSEIQDQGEEEFRFDIYIFDDKIY